MSRRESTARRRSPFVRFAAAVLSGFVLPACGGDPCRALCTDTTRELAACLDGWGYTWEDLGAESRVGWRTDCQADWDATRAALEARQIPDAEGRCEDASVTLEALTCDELWAVYF